MTQEATAKQIISPFIHMNGTSKEALIREYEAAWEAVNNAIEKMQGITVNARDYYPYDGGGVSYDSYGVADKEHRNRIIKLGSVKNELELLINNIDSDDRQQFLEVPE